MSGPRVTGPASKIARSLSTSAAAAVPKTSNGSLLSSTKVGAPLSRKYADLLKERNIEWDSHPRHIMTQTSNRPHPPQNKLRLMQTFSSTAAPKSQATMDSMAVPEGRISEYSSSAIDNIRVPLLPDNFITSHTPEAEDAPVIMAEINVVAANPETVTPAALTEVEGMGVDGVELKFVHQEAEAEPSMIQNMWKGLVNDVNNLGGGPRLAV